MDINIKEIKEVLDQANEDINNISQEEFQKKYLGRNGLIKDILGNIVHQDDKKEYGRQANILRAKIEELINYREEICDNENKREIDTTAPFDINTKKDQRPRTKKYDGTIHPLSQEMDYILKIFQKMGFSIVESRQLDDDYHMFEALNFPIGHPARDMYDSFWTDEGLTPPGHTSTMQNRVLKMHKPPIRCVIPGRCFRNEATNSSHEHTFYQIEGVYVDKKVSIGDMFGTIKTYLEAFFETKLEIKMQPCFFPFVEPGCEFMISCPFCKKTGCSVCGFNGWMEIVPCGMIHPNVLEHAGIDSTEYSGFAWGLGLDRMVMIKNQITDIRKFHSGDINFLKQF